MKSLHILLLEDTIADSQNIINLLSKDYNITLANTIKKAKDTLASSLFDLAILDISINGKLDGIEFAKHIQSTPTPIPFFFLTSMQSRAVFDQAKLTKPFTYLLKPFNVMELQYSIELVIEKHFEQKNALRSNTGLLTPDYLLIKKQDKICKVILDTIEYVEVEENYSTLYTSNQNHVIKKSLSKIKEMLLDKNFEQIHRKFLINFDKITEINLSENTVYLSPGFQASISERFKKKLIHRYGIIT
ncbi:LytR/AlgR family response regulator transcription factor [Flavivirga jejuensis]|uniref:Response regulator transcription factor n=1 Tax=Flavivirga jejuensis TaxID=870487 RepID=A0ABT8WQ30_9FLAO|nr:response regulator transcription factor [Flavivirga jejuensis]MDO5975274.1 response regulator transcription factor [Flavivirga jejuensis]